jgi:hypothetical protein
MDQFVRAYYEVVFERDYLKKTASEFQDFFSEIMEKAHPEDFIRTRPWGNLGDRKNDGYLRSARTLFQVYAPNKMEDARTIAKIDEDFCGALPYWREYFDKWVFVHNSQRGISPGVERKLLELDQAHADIQVRPWGFEELRREAFSLCESDLASLLGPVPSRADILNVTIRHLEVVLLNIAGAPIPASVDLRPVSPRKLAANGLSESVRVLLSAGMVASGRVREFFDGYYDPQLGDRVVQAFSRKYVELRQSDMLPDEIFLGLQLFAGGTPPASAQRQAAVLTVLAYLFEACDIFEPPPEGLQP